MDLWFAISAFADNAGIYERIVANSGNADAAVLAGRALANAARRVDETMQTARTSYQFQNAWANIRRQMTALSNGTM